MSEPASIYLIAGEVSGDTHGAELIHALRHLQANVQTFGTGGPLMRKASEQNIHDWVEDAAVMGIWEVLKHYRWFKKQYDKILAEIKELKPDALVLIDYPGFNLRIAKDVRKALPNTKIIYYISPQVWAWNKKRIPVMAEVLDLMLCIFPFEKPIFEEAGLKTKFVGHPIVDELEAKRITTDRDPKLAGLFPGSREREVARLFPVMIETARRLKVDHPQISFQAPAASPKLAKLMRHLVEQADLLDNFIEITEGGSHELMQRAGCAVIASGTATLEAAYYGLPYCLIYKIAWPSYILGKLLVKIEFIGLVNILAGKKVVEEFIQCEADPAQIQGQMSRFINSPSVVIDMQDKLKETSKLLGDSGCHTRAASQILNELASS